MLLIAGSAGDICVILFGIAGVCDVCWWHVQIRSRVDTSFTAPNAPQDVVSMSAAYAAYMASSSNLRLIGDLLPECFMMDVFPELAHTISVSM